MDNWYHLNIKYGWVIFSLSELLARLPEDHPDHEALVNHFRDLTEGNLGLQDENGLWHQILDEKETYEDGFMKRADGA